MQRTSLSLATLLFCGALAAPAHADDAALRAEVEALRAEVAALKAEVHGMHLQTASPATAANATATTSAPVAATNSAAPTSGARDVAASSSSNNASGGAAGSTSFWGYGELNYNHPTARAADAQADLRRAVLGFNHVFDDATRVYGELEWEHAIASADDKGESEIEQLYVEHALGANYGVRAGLMLVPLGLLNEHHEPVNYYGVERNYVETAIIPSTWREGGVALYGNTESGLSWNLGIGTGPNLGKWDATASEGRESPLGSIHQELQLAKARDPSIYAAANWQGVPGLLLGGGVFTGKIGQGQTAPPVEKSRLTLGEVHARWQPGPFDLSALYVRGEISHTQDANLTFLGQPTPVPKEFWGGYVQGAWRAVQWGESTLAPFLRYEAFNTASAYAAQPQGLGAMPLPTERVWTAGLNYFLNSNVVFKFDYQHFNNADEELGYGKRFNLGVGYQF
ncbi:MAG: hypothetical protein E6K53_10610 [Gammaproteobacteria bacterium]|nr:MAG: hypothetical protein E6K53_10610 [Gammaproteobacteria bacterium]